jgi:4-hydroxybenzoate polyprenyltransferase
VNQREGQTFGGDSLLISYVNLVKLPHTLFALPFALLGVVLASYRSPVSWSQLVAVALAFTAARFFAMGFNRIADRELDALNPRTRERELPAGRIGLRDAWIAVVVAAVVFVAAAGWLNRLCLVLSPVALTWIALYSYSKRWTHWSHLWLGISLASAPVGGYLAITGGWSDSGSLLLIAAAVATWVAGFDIFYALQDQAFDRAHGLKSAVVWLGEVRAILAAKLLHGVTIVALVGVGMAAGLSVWYFGGVALAAGLLAWEHQLVRPGDLRRLDAAFFLMNGVISIVVFLGAFLDRIL